MPPSVQQAIYELQERAGKMLGSQKSFLSAPEEQSIIAGGFACVAAETLVSGVPIAERSHQTVQTLFGPARPSDPFLKGRADLYEVLTQSGRRVAVTVAHRFLTPNGWRRLSDLRVGDFLAAYDTSRDSSVSERELDSRDYCSQDFRLDDELLLSGAQVCQDKLPRFRRTNDGGNARLVSNLHSNKRSSHQKRPEDAFLSPSRVAFDELLQTVLGTQLHTCLQSPNKSFLSDTTEQSLRSVDYAGIFGTLDSLCISPTHYSFWDAIVSISFLRNGQFYDLHVPGFEHYEAQGLWHHNSGKTHICCTKGLILSSIFPGNRGLVGRYHSTDLEDSTIPVFFDVCPPSWIRAYNKQTKRLVFKNGSEVIFRHLHDASAQTKSRRVGANLGWAFIDQVEECQMGHWNTMLGRLRLPAAKKKYLFGAMNPAGHDDFYKLFFEGIDEDLRSLPHGTFHRVIRKSNRFGIVVNSNENRKSNGGFVDDGYFDEMIASYPQDWLDRYIYCSFADFAGKIYRAYNLTSVHNVKPFTYPKHWNAIIGIDVGGDAPWAVLDERVDEFGNMIIVNEFYKSSVNVAEVAGWIKANTPWSDPNTIFIIDYENKLAMLELAEHGIHCRPAVKKVKPGILRTGGYYSVQKGMGLPSWYRETQPGDRYEKFKDAGSPRAFCTENCVNFRREQDNYLWDKDDKPKKINDHCPDADRYVKFSRPMASKLPAHDKYQQLRAIDPSSAREWEAFDRRMQARVNKRNGVGSMVELSYEEAPVLPARMTQEYEWGD